MILSMDTDSNNDGQKAIWPVTPVSLRPDQREWLDREKVRQKHGNRSRIVQEAIDRYREQIEGGGSGEMQGVA